MIPAIDTHAHVGDANGFPQKGKEKEFLSLPFEDLERNMQAADVKAVLASPAEGIFPYGGNTVEEANRRMEKWAQRYPWVYQWVVVHPEIQETYRQAREMLKSPKCVGIKIHPDAHRYPISQYGEEIFGFAAGFETVVQTHTGAATCLPEDFVEYADRYPEINILLSHLGNNSDGDVGHQVRAISQSRHGNLYTDVSSMKSILFQLIEWAVKEVGADKLLFGTDTPLHHIGMMRSRIDYADLSTGDKEKIFYRNAMRVIKNRSLEELILSYAK